jgi:hypothetical protein
MKSKRLTDDDMVKDIINTMFIIAGYNVSYEDIKDRKDKWYEQWTMTPEQEEKWTEWMVSYLRKHRRLTVKYAQRSASMYNLMWGLKVNRPELEQEND